MLSEPINRWFGGTESVLYLQVAFGDQIHGCSKVFLWLEANVLPTTWRKSTAAKYFYDWQPIFSQQFGESLPSWEDYLLPSVEKVTRPLLFNTLLSIVSAHFELQTKVMRSFNYYFQVFMDHGSSLGLGDTKKSKPFCTFTSTFLHM